jgi:hypothetical protein
MNPYLESDIWHDFHQRYIPALSAAIVPQVAPDFIVTLEEHVYVHELPDDERVLRVRPDVSVLSAEPRAGEHSSVSVVTPPEYTLIRPAVDVERESYIAIKDRQRRELVCVIELLSPANKRSGPDREAYVSKRDALLRSQAHLVEIDLLRGWERMPAESMPKCDYCIIVSRVEERPRAGVWRIGLREPLPTVPVPLRGSHPDARVNLQEVLHQVYDQAGYRYHIYDNAPEPRLSGDDAAWARQTIGDSIAR